MRSSARALGVIALMQSPGVVPFRAVRNNRVVTENAWTSTRSRNEALHKWRTYH